MKEDPKKLFERIKTVETQYNTKSKKIKEEDKIAVVLSRKHNILIIPNLQETIKQHY